MQFNSFTMLLCGCLFPVSFLFYALGIRLPNFYTIPQRRYEAMRILFVNKFLDKEAIFRTPLGIMSLSAMVKDDHEVKIVDPKDQDITRVMESFKPQILAYSLRTGYHQYYLDLNRKLKAKYEFLSVFGGPHVTFYPKIIEESGVDVIGFGEVDESFKELVDRYDRGEDISTVQNFWVKTLNGISKNPKRTLVSDLDELPFPDRNLFDEHKEVDSSKVHPFIASRGCPFKCTYCFNAGMADEYKGEKYVRRRSVSHVMEEVRQVKEKYDLKVAIFEDDTFNLSKKWVREFCVEFAKLDIKLIPIGLRAELINEEQIKYLKMANCTGLVFGLESGDMQIRRNVLKRNITDEQMIEASRLLHKYEIRFMTENLVGIPGTSLEDDIKTLELNLNCNPFIANAHILQPYPGTELYEYSVKNGFFNKDGFDELGGFYDTSTLRIDNRKERVRLAKLFGIIVAFPFLHRFTHTLISLPLDGLYTLLQNGFKAYVGIRWVPYRRSIGEYLSLFKRFFSSSDTNIKVVDAGGGTRQTSALKRIPVEISE